MTAIKSTILGICISLILTGFFLKLLPKGKMSKNMRNILSLLMLLIIISPLSRSYAIDWDSFKFDYENSASFSETEYKNRVVENLMILMQKDIEKYLKEKKLGYYSVVINTDSNNEISGVTVKIKSGYDPTEVERLVTKEFDLPCIVNIGN